MTPIEMAKACTDILESYSESGWPLEKANVTFVTPKGFKKPNGFPRGYLLQVRDDGTRIWHFPAIRVLAWINAQVAVSSATATEKDAT